MRQALNNTWVKYGTGLVFGIIIVSFVLFFGPQTQGMGPSARTWVAKIGGRTVTDAELASAFERYRRLSNERTRLEDDEYADVQRQLALNIAAIELLADRAQEAGLAVSDDDLQCFLVNWHRGYSVDGERICAPYPADYEDRFRNFDILWFTEADGTFTSYYDETVRNRFNMATDAYERHKERELLARFYLASLAASITVPPGQIHDVWQRRNTTVDLEYIALDPDSAGASDLSDDEVAAWAAANPDAIQAAYDADPERFAEERQVRIRRIYIQRPDEDSPEYEAALERYQTALRRVTEGGEDFEAVARELSENEREAASGGDMGMRTAATISTDIWEVTEGMSAGDVEGVEQRYAWNVIKLEEVQEARTRPLGEVRDEIAAELAGEEARAAAAEQLAERGRRILELAATADSLGDAARREADEATAAMAEAMNLEGDGAGLLEADDLAVEPLDVSTTGPFARERPSPFLSMGGAPAGVEFPPEPADTVPGIGASRELVRVAFSLTPDAPLHDSLIRVDGVDYVVRLAARVEALDEIPDERRAAITSELRGRLVDSVIGDANQLAALALNMPGPMAPVVGDLIDDALESGELELKASFFAPADPVDEI